MESVESVESVEVAVEGKEGLSTQDPSSKRDKDRQVGQGRGGRKRVSWAPREKSAHRRGRARSRGGNRPTGDRWSGREREKERKKAKSDTVVVLALCPSGGGAVVLVLGMYCTGIVLVLYRARGGRGERGLGWGVRDGETGAERST